MTDEHQLAIVAIDIVEHILDELSNRSTDDDHQQEIKDDLVDIVLKRFKTYSIGIK